VRVLLERGQELDAIDTRLAAARAGNGGVLAIEAAAGLGKTRLLEAARTRAGADGMRVLAASGSDLEQAFTFGVVRQLWESAVDAAGADPLFAVANALYRAVGDVAADTPVAVVVDDAQWADAASLRCLAYLARRAGDLPVALLVAIRSGPDADAVPGELTAGARLSPAPRTAAVAQGNGARERLRSAPARRAP